jgi:hypothetical protein
MITSSMSFRLFQGFIKVLIYIWIAEIKIHVLVSECVSILQITDQFEGYIFDQYTDSMKMLLKNCRNM